MLTLHSKNDTTIVKGKAEAYCEKHGITQRTGSPYLHENNSRAKVLNKLIQARARAMLLTAGLPATMWPLSMMHSAYVVNRTPKAAAGVSAFYPIFEKACVRVNAFYPIFEKAWVRVSAFYPIFEKAWVRVSAFYPIFEEEAEVGGLVAGLIFAVHPIHTEAVANVTGRAELLSGLFYVLAFLAYASLTAETPDTRVAEARAPEAAVAPKLYTPGQVLRQVAAVGAAAVCGAAAMLCKEQGLTVLAVCALYDVCFHLRLHIGTALGDSRQ
eukprot:gene7863-9338_t